MIVGHIGGGSVGGYQVQRSVRLRSAASAYFSRTFGSPTGSNTFTWSGWVKRGTLGVANWIINPVNSNGEGALFNASNQLSVSCNGSFLLVSTQVFRDPSAWYHIVLAADMGNSTASLRFRVYVNGTEITSWATDARASFTAFTSWNKSTVVHQIGYNAASPAYSDLYHAEQVFVDGQALTPSSFAEQDTATRMWVPKKYTGTYGTNGFYLDFSTITSTTTLGYDKSGNGNNWTANNISLTSGITYDSMLDVPGLPWSDGGNGRGNYCVLNPLEATSSATISDGNLSAASLTNTQNYGSGTIRVRTGKWYFETVFSNVASSTALYVGVAGPAATAYYASNGQYFNGSAWAAYGATYASGDMIGVAFDADNGSITFYKNGTSQGQLTGFSFNVNDIRPFISLYIASGIAYGYANFGQRPFAYTPPTGFKALNTANLPDPTGAAAKPWEHFDVVLATGANIKTTAEAVFPSNYLEWIKDRANANNHQLIDIVRGSSAVLQSNTTAAETTYSAPSGSSVGWVWKAGGSPVSNTNGTITSQVSANTAAGVSIVTYTGTGANATVGHGQGVAPSLVIAKKRSNTGNWPVYHSARGATRHLTLNTTNAESTSAAYWNNTAPTSSVFSIQTDTDINASGSTYVAYCFAEVSGFSKFGSYTGNGSSDGPFVFCGFRPKWVLFKRTDTANNWMIVDTVRNTANVVNLDLYPDLNFAEQVETANIFDTTANGFKVRGTGNGTNTSGGTYVYTAFAESPFKYSNAR